MSDVIFAVTAVVSFVVFVVEVVVGVAVAVVHSEILLLHAGSLPFVGAEVRGLAGGRGWFRATGHT